MMLEIVAESDGPQWIGQVIKADTVDVDAFREGVVEHVMTRKPAKWGWRRLPRIVSERDFENGQTVTFCICRVFWSKEQSEVMEMLKITEAFGVETVGVLYQ